ncbi:S8 family serine peptidase [Rudaea sp. 3F27F6]|uniref:S8 family serine peptidase n=1 Tax=Rudaea sp. 3F27F6 TaxID=2502208 RepID=UPI0010F68949|nr:S8 family serine peptidase [Rudaea sp. 3F27F6]
MRASIAALVLFLFALFGAAAASAEVPPSSTAAREILVMLRLPPPHYRPGANYGGSYTDSAGSAARRRIAESLAREQGLEVLSGWPMPAIGVDCYVLRVPPGANLDDVVRRLSQDRRAEWAQPMNLFRARAAEGNTAAKASLYSLQPSARLWRLDEMHRVSTGRGVRVAVIDSGADAEHPDLIGRIEVERNFVDTREHTAEAHGTAVAGIIGARGADAGVVGIAPASRLLALRACWEEAAATLCSSFTLAQALQFAIGEDAQVINLSLSGPDDPLLARLIDAAIERGASVVGAVDADAINGGFPASHRGVLAVSDRAGAASASILYVPGADVPAPAPGGRWNFVTGASFAAAQIAGVIALVREVSPAPAMRQSAAWVRFPPSSPDGAAGYVDACATLQRSVPSLNCASARAGTARVSR